MQLAAYILLTNGSFAPVGLDYISLADKNRHKSYFHSL